MFKHHRDILRKSLPSHLIVLTAYDELQLSGDMAAPYMQESSFWYLTGIEEQGWKLIFDTAADQSWLVAPHVDAMHQVFDGSLSSERAKEISGVDAIIDESELKQWLEVLAKKYDTVHTLGKDPHAQYYSFTLNPAQGKLTKVLKSHFKNIEDCRRDLAKIKALKTDDEMTAMRKAAKLTVEAFEKVKQSLQAKRYEFEIEADFTYAFRTHSAAVHAYEPIVAAGVHACTLHYVKNDGVLPKNGLVLIDVGARVDGYAADVTRTYAIGAPTEREKAVHAAVEKAHHEIIALLKPGLRLDEYSNHVDVIMKNALVSLGLIREEGDYRKYFPHAISHGLGIDVHDSLGGHEALHPGMVLTVEPGIYIPEEGIGVRIEDDILITEAGHENLTAALPTGL